MDAATHRTCCKQKIRHSLAALMAVAWLRAQVLADVIHIQMCLSGEQLIHTKVQAALVEGAMCPVLAELVCEELGGSGRAPEGL